MPELLKALHELARSRKGEMAIPYLAVTVNAGVAPWHQTRMLETLRSLPSALFAGGRLRVCSASGKVGSFGLRHQWLRFDG
eukprot:3001389-Amphidinium_carterae.1